MTATLSSGYTNRLTANAIRCDQQRILERLKGGTGGCSASSASSASSATSKIAGGGVNASVLELNAQQGCLLTPQEQLLLPKAGVPESVRIQRVQQNVLSCSVDPLDPLTRFSMYTRFVPQAPCPPPTAAQLNSTQPIAPTRGCFHSRFYSPPLS